MNQFCKALTAKVLYLDPAPEKGLGFMERGLAFNTKGIREKIEPSDRYLIA
ncbi:MAG: hypothetical protein RLZZ140_1092 [Pseudomonadota bacterium]